jgi:hypothetical protein
MKKVVLGCLGVLVVATIGAGIAGYFFLYKPAKSYVQSFSQLQELPTLNASIRNKAPFTPPESGALNEELVSRFMAAQQTLHETLGARVDALDAKYKVLREANGSDQPSISEGLGALKDLGGLILDAKRAQVEALNRHAFSLAEYDWVRRRVYAASGIPMSLDIEHMIKQAQEGSSGDGSFAEEIAGPVSETDKQLVAPHLEKLRERAGLAFFGL